MGNIVTSLLRRCVKRDDDTARQELGILVKPANNRYTRIEIDTADLRYTVINIGKFSIWVMDFSDPYRDYLRTHVYQLIKIPCETKPPKKRGGRKPDPDCIPISNHGFLNKEEETRTILEICLRGKNVGVDFMTLEGNKPITLRDVPPFSVKRLTIDKHVHWGSLLDSIKAVETIEMRLTNENVSLLSHPVIKNANRLLLRTIPSDYSNLHHVESKYAVYGGNIHPSVVLKICQKWKRKKLPIGAKFEFLNSSVAFLNECALLLEQNEGAVINRHENMDFISIPIGQESSKIQITLVNRYLEIEIVKQEETVRDSRTIMVKALDK